MLAKLIRVGLFLFLCQIRLVFGAGLPDIFIPYNDQLQPLSAQIEYLEEDIDSLYTIDQVVNGQVGEFKPLVKKNFGFGYTKILWIRFTANLESYREPYWFLTQNYEHVGHLTLFYPKADGFHALQLTEDEPADKRFFKIHNYLFKVPTPETFPTTYYIRYDPKGHALSVDLSWAGIKGIVEFVHNSQLALGLFFGGLCVMWLYNCVLFFHLRSRDYLYYLYYLGCFIATFVYLNGFAPLLIRSVKIYEPLFATCAYGAIHGMVLFARQFLSLSTSVRWLDIYLKGCQYILFIGVVVAPFLPIGTPYPILNYLILITMPMLMVAGFIRWYQGYVPARLYSIGWSLFAAALGIYSLRLLGLLPSTWFTNYAIQIASLWEAILFALALAHRIKVCSQEAAMAKNAFIGMISHELRTPLQTIISAIDLLAMRNSEKPKNVEVMKTLRLAAEHLEMQMRDLTDYARFDSGKTQLRKTAFNASQLILQIANEFRFTVERKGLQLTTDVEASHYFVLSDALRIQQIVNNLIINAIKYTDKGFIKISLQYQRENRKSMSLVIKVEDSGIGISPENMQNLFRPFTQVNQSNPRKHEGIGMGLAIVKRLVLLFGGTVKVNSVLGSGSCFEVCIPTEEVEIIGAEITTAGNECKRKYHLLLVDDTVEVGKALSAILEELNYCCDVVICGEDAIEHVNTKQYDAILLDVNMPDMDGFAVATAIRKNAGINQNIPIIWISATAPQIVTSEQRNLFSYFLEKPIHSKKLDVMLRQILDGVNISSGVCRPEV